MRLGIVGGSSLVKMDLSDEFACIGLKVAEAKAFVHKTPYGAVHMKRFELKGKGAVAHSIIFIQRHSHTDGGIEKGITPPHNINYKANMRALADQKLDLIVATSR